VDAPRRLLGLVPFALLTALLLGLSKHLAGGPWLDFVTPALRALAGVAWGLWFGAVVSWPVLKATLRRRHLPEDLLDFLDAALVHGLTLVRTLERRRETAYVRLGHGRPRRTLELHGRILASGVTGAFDRAVSLEEARSLRRAVPSALGEAYPALELRGVTARHGDGSPALGPLDLTLAPGEWLGLAGASGAGKTTLLRLAAGLLAPDGGHAERFGRSLAPGGLHGRLDGRVAWVPQDPDDSLLGSTPLEDLIWGLRQRGLDTASACERAEELLDALDLTALAHRPVHRLSFGERKRLAFAGALAGDPELLLCDEPTSGLDAVAAARLLALLAEARVRRPRLAVIWATHDREFWPAGIERAVLLTAGRVFFDGPTSSALAPATLRAAGLLPAEPASPPLPLIRGAAR
jgi:cobalt/nickel transport system ATP-binding protein